MSRWDPEKIELMELAHTWKRRAEEAEDKLHDLLRRQDEMAAQVERLQEKLACTREDKQIEQLLKGGQG